MDRRWTGIGDAVLAAALLAVVAVCATSQRWPEAAGALVLALAWGAAAARRLAGRRAADAVQAVGAAAAAAPTA
ncbi:hypothetical protein, partial [Kineococcus indalonis]|uniref:hypothetical protein n=1 Tax=Kineococcus indalonis TaxID=2696566 RepID=UPI00196AAD8E